MSDRTETLSAETVTVHRVKLASLARDLEIAADADTDSLSDMADSLEIAREVAETLRNLLQR